MNKIRYTTLLKVIEEYVKKCPATQQAKNIGSTGKWTTEKNEWGETLNVITYGNGTVIKFGGRGIEDYYNENEHFFPDTDINLYAQGEVKGKCNGKQERRIQFL